MLTLFTPFVPFLLGAIGLVLGGTVYGAIRLPGDRRDRVAFRIVALLIAASWVASGALAIRAL